MIDVDFGNIKIQTLGKFIVFDLKSLETGALRMFDFREIDEALECFNSIKDSGKPIMYRAVNVNEEKN